MTNNRPKLIAVIATFAANVFARLVLTSLGYSAFPVELVIFFDWVAFRALLNRHVSHHKVIATVHEL